MFTCLFPFIIEVRVKIWDSNPGLKDYPKVQSMDRKVHMSGANVSYILMSHFTVPTMATMMSLSGLLFGSTKQQELRVIWLMPPMGTQVMDLQATRMFFLGTPRSLVSRFCLHKSLASHPTWPMSKTSATTTSIQFRSLLLVKSSFLNGVPFDMYPMQALSVSW